AVAARDRTRRPQAHRFEPDRHPPMPLLRLHRGLWLPRRLQLGRAGPVQFLPGRPVMNRPMVPRDAPLLGPRLKLVDRQADRGPARGPRGDGARGGWGARPVSPPPRRQIAAAPALGITPGTRETVIELRQRGAARDKIADLDPIVIDPPLPRLSVRVLAWA